MRHSKFVMLEPQRIVYVRMSNWVSRPVICIFEHSLLKVADNLDKGSDLECEDIDECLVADRCPIQARCENNEGSYKCLCENGLRSEERSRKSGCSNYLTSCYSRVET